MAPGESNGHVSDDVTWPWKVKVVIQIYLDTNILNWIVQCFTSPPTQYRLYGRRFSQVKRPNQQYGLRGDGLVRLIGAVVCLLCCAAGPLVRYHGQWMAANRATVSSAHANQAVHTFTVFRQFHGKHRRHVDSEAEKVSNALWDLVE